VLHVAFARESSYSLIIVKRGGKLRSLDLGKVIVSENGPAYVIAEIGHNHQGKLEQAIELIRAAADAGASAVKLQKRNNRRLYTPQAFNEIYNSENSFAETYGLHREALEFGKKEFEVCLQVAQEEGVDFFATPFDIDSADFLEELGLTIYKIASGDLQNIPLIRHVASFQKPMIISTGGASLEMIDRAIQEIRFHHNKVAILQCTASYPAGFDQLNLRFISELQSLYPENIIGYSGHDNGIAMATVAYALGARVIEKHFTLNRTLKGTDHAFSLEPQGMKKLVRDLERASLALGDGKKVTYDSEVAPLTKMGKMICASRDLPQSHIIAWEDLEYRSPAHGLPPSMADWLVGRQLIQPVKKFDPIKLEHIN